MRVLTPPMLISSPARQLAAPAKTGGPYMMYTHFGKWQRNFGKPEMRGYEPLSLLASFAISLQRDLAILNGRPWGDFEDFLARG